MRLNLFRFRLTKAVPLAISRGSSASSERLLVQLEHDGVTGIGETGGFETGHRHFETAAIAAELANAAAGLESARLEHATSTLDLAAVLTATGADPEPLPQRLDPFLVGLSAPARCGLDLALHDWWGRRLGQPVHRLWGLEPGACVPTSVTLGLGEPAAVLSRLERWWTQLPATRIKLKLGSPDGLAHDRALVLAVATALEQRQHHTGGPCELQVDANGGWNLEQARAMAPWLAEQGVVLLEQPLAPLAEAKADTARFAALKHDCPLPLVADESCWDHNDLLRLAPHVDGINIKLLKCGGLSEGLRMARTAQQLGLSVMVGCYGDGSLLNGAAAQLLPLVTWPDLDSHLNLLDDPFAGLVCEGDRLLPPAGVGLGIDRVAPLTPPQQP